MRLQTLVKRHFRGGNYKAGAIVDVPTKVARILLKADKNWIEPNPEDLGERKPPEPPPTPEVPPRRGRGRPAKVAEPVSRESEVDQGGTGEDQGDVTGAATEVAAESQEGNSAAEPPVEEAAEEHPAETEDHASDAKAPPATTE